MWIICILYKVFVTIWMNLPEGRKETSCHRSRLERTQAPGVAAPWCCHSNWLPFSVNKKGDCLQVGLAVAGPKQVLMGPSGHCLLERDSWQLNLDRKEVSPYPWTASLQGAASWKRKPSFSITTWGCNDDRPACCSPVRILWMSFQDMDLPP